LRKKRRYSTLVNSKSSRISLRVSAELPSFLPFRLRLIDRCSGLKAQPISTRYGYHRAYFDDHIRIRQTPAPPAGQVREPRSTPHPFDLGGTTLRSMGGSSSTVARSASFPVPACEMVSIRL
jgi:hypothetical protein